MDEVAAVARAKDIDLPDDTIEEWVSFAEELEPDTSSSLHYDLSRGKQLELDALNGSIVRHAAEVGVDVPMNEAVTAILQPWMTGTR
jgi:2-dehydropantoate 2-reductase